MLPWSVEKVPEARVATQPPTVLEWSDCGKWPSEQPCSFSRRSSSTPDNPGPGVGDQRDRIDAQPVESLGVERDATRRGNGAADDARPAAERDDRDAPLAGDPQDRAHLLRVRRPDDAAGQPERRAVRVPVIARRIVFSSTGQTPRAFARRSLMPVETFASPSAATSAARAGGEISWSTSIIRVPRPVPRIGRCSIAAHDHSPRPGSSGIEIAEC